MSENNKPCPEFPYWGAFYPDARCVDGILYDLDRCDSEGNLYHPIEDIPCPFCRTEEFIDCDPLGKKEEYYKGIEDEEEAEDKARKWYLNYISKLRDKYGDGNKVVPVKTGVEFIAEERRRQINVRMDRV